MPSTPFSAWSKQMDYDAWLDRQLYEFDRERERELAEREEDCEEGEEDLDY
jgi:hypothetical protein